MDHHPTAELPLIELLFERAGAGLCLVSPDGVVVRTNAAWLRATGRTAEQVVGKELVGLLPEDRAAAPALLARARAGAHVEIPRHARTVNGRATWWEGSIEPVRMEGGTGLLIAVRDVGSEFQVFYETAPAAFLVLAPDRPRFTILAASEAYLRATKTSRDIVGRGIFEVFPDDPDDPASSGSNARISFERVLDTGVADAMAVQKHSIRRPESEGGGFEERYWSPVNTPVIGDRGEVLYVHHRVEDVTEFVRQKQKRAEQEAIAETLRTRAGEMEADVLRRAQEIQEVNRQLRVANDRLAELDRIKERRAQEALRDSEESARRRAAELHVVLDAVPAAVFITRDRHASQMEANRFCAEILRMPVGSNVSKSAAPGEVPRSFRAMRNGTEIPPDQLPVQLAAATGRVVRGYEFDLVFADGEVRHLFGNAEPLIEPDGEVRGAVGAFLDITERKQAENALRGSEERLREEHRRKDEFLGMLSHELRNPLAPIRNAIYILRHADPGGRQASRAHDVIERQTEHLTRLVDDLLDVTRIARGKIELRRERIDLREVVRRTAEDFHQLMHDRGIVFRTELPERRVWTNADATRIAQVVGNLLHNAAKFTRRGDEVSVTLSAAGGEAEVRVRDTGAGIDPALLPQVFVPFVQGERTLARTEGGLGLGLALVKGITELHGGAVHVESAGTGKGAEFVVRLPLVEAAVAQVVPGRGLERGNGGRRVLVVDDNADAAESLAEILGMLGHTVEIAYDGPSAVEKARASVPDVVLCDVGLPGMSGYEVARTLRASGEGMQLFAVSGYAQPEDVKRAVEAGFDAHLAKPLNIEDIERLLA